LAYPPELTGDYRNKITDGLKTQDYPEFLLIENADIVLKAEGSTNAKLNFYIEKNKRIFASVKFLGFEIVRAELTNDSVKYINRLKREYYFGSVDENKGNLPLTYDLKLLQNFIYSGFYFDNGLKKRDFLRNFLVLDNMIQYKKDVDEGQKIVLNYDSNSVKLDKITLSDEVNDLLAEIDIERKNPGVETVKALFVINENITSLEVSIKEISYKSYSKTDFKTGRNYTRLEKIY
jgi:hypothetical protein